MSISEIHAYFDLLLDKYSNPYFTDAEKDSFLTQASVEYVKRHLPSPENGGVNLEFDQLSFNNIYTLVFTTGSATMNGSGVITQSALQTLLNTASGSTEAMMGVLDVNWTRSGSTYPVKYTRHNNWWAYSNNTFKAGSITVPRYKYDKANISFSPIDTNATIIFTLLKQPKETSLSGGTTIELPAHTHKAVVEIATDLAATSVRDIELAQLNQK
jgi:hypothetical protein